MCLGENSVCWFVLFLEIQNKFTLVHRRKLIFYEDKTLQGRKNYKKKKKKDSKELQLQLFWEEKGLYLSLVCWSKAFPLRAVQMSIPMIINTALLLIIWIWLLPLSMVSNRLLFYILLLKGRLSELTFWNIHLAP